MKSVLVANPKLNKITSEIAISRVESFLTVIEWFMWEISRRQLICRLICKPVRYRTVDQADHIALATAYSCQRASVSHQKLTKTDTNLQNFQDITERWFHANDLIHFLSRIIGLSSKSF